MTDAEPYATRREFDQFRTEVTMRFAEHQRQHEREEDHRISARRWSLGFAVAGLTAIAGLYPFVLAVHR